MYPNLKTKKMCKARMIVLYLIIQCLDGKLKIQIKIL